MLREIAGFVAVGGTGGLAFIVISSLIVWADTGVPAFVVSALVWAGLIVPVYLGHHRFSFRTGVRHSQGLPRYASVQAGGVVLAAGFSYIAYDFVGLKPPFAAIPVAGATAAVNFVLLKLWAFAAPKQ